MKDIPMLPTRCCDLCVHAEMAAEDYGWCKFPLPFWVLHQLGAVVYRGKPIHPHQGHDCPTFQRRPNMKELLEAASKGSGKRLKSIKEANEMSLSVPVDMGPFVTQPDTK